MEASSSKTHSFSDVIFSLCSSGKGAIVQAWDIQNGGVLRSYRGDGGEGEGNSLAMAGKDYLLVSLKSKPLILVWKMEREQIFMKIACTGIIHCVICDTTGYYCIGALNDKINIWEICSGLLVGVVSKHYQPIECLRYVDCGYFASGGKDCLAIVWNLASVLSEYRGSHSAEDPNAPKTFGVTKNSILHIWSDHSMAVTGIATSGRGYNKKIATSSLDQTCKIYDFASGSILCTFLYNAPLSCITLTTCGLWLYAGSSTGTLHCTPLFLPSKENGAVRQVDAKFSQIMKEHKKSISSLCVSFTGKRFVSSSMEGVSKVWDASSKQVLLSINHKGPIVCSILCRNIWRFTQLHSTKPAAASGSATPPIKSFQKHTSYKTDAVSAHTITLHSRPLHMVRSC
uniref:Uncharacterized protein n=1 Tax=Amphimedon queenslandica TaxID=400682 RepID=A0A1X7UBS0_AMPQE